MTRLAVVIGDPTGIGPEVTAKALAAAQGLEVLLVGDLQVWEDTRRLTGVSLPAAPAGRPAPVGASVAFAHLPPADRTWRPGAMSPAAGKAAAGWLEAAVCLALDGIVDGIVFAPLNKQAIIRAGYQVRDEYELCAALAGIREHDEMNVIPHPARADTLLWVARATSHVALRDVAAALSRDLVLRTIRMAHQAASGAGEAAPRIGVAALNPHAGEGGLLGDEEQRIIEPAIRAAAGEGLQVSGPHPADHIFRLARAGQFDVVVSMYHDQAQIATKLLGFDQGVSVGVGYPFVMTTPSHGTAFDIAGKGIADAGPMRQALAVAERLASRHRRPR